MSSTPCTVTVCAVLHRLVAAAVSSPPVGTNDSVPLLPYVVPPSTDTSHSLLSWLETATDTVACGSVARRTVNVSVPPASVVAVEPPLSATISFDSSLSLIVSVAVEPW